MKKMWFIALIVAGMFLFAACDDSEDEVKDYEEDLAVMVADSYSEASSDEMYTVDEAVYISGSENGVAGSYNLDVTLPLGAGSSSGSYSYTFSDQQGDVYDDMHWEGSHTGEWNIADRFVYSYSRNYSLDLDGCSTEIVTINGNGEASVQMEFSALYYIFQRQYSLSWSHEYQNVTIARDAEYPSSGTVVFDVNGERNSSSSKRHATGSFSAHVEMTFDGDSTPTIVVNGNRAFSADLALGTVTEI